MSDVITHARFAERLSYLASHITSWAGSCLTLPEEHAKPMRASSVERFIDEVQSRLDFLREDLAVLQSHERLDAARTRPHERNPAAHGEATGHSEIATQRQHGANDG